MYFDEPAKAFDPQRRRRARRAGAVDGAGHLLRARAGAADRRGDGRGEVAVLNDLADREAELADPRSTAGASSAYARVGSTNDEARRARARGRSRAAVDRRATNRPQGSGRHGRVWQFAARQSLCERADHRPLRCRDRAADRLCRRRRAASGRRRSRRRGDVELKWPNDLVWRGAKLAGLLVEGVTTPGDGASPASSASASTASSRRRASPTPPRI